MTTPSDPTPPSPQPPQAPGRRLHIAAPLAAGSGFLRQGLIFAVFLGLGTGNFLVVLGIAALAAAVAIGLGYLGWSRFTFGVSNGVLRVDHGILTRSRREVPLTRIQQVDLNRPVIHRLLGLTIVRVDTAGGSGDKAEIVLNALADADATALRHELVGHHASDPTEAASAPTPDLRRDPDPHAVWPLRSSLPLPPPPVAPPVAPPTPPTPMVHLSTRDLVIAGVTGRHLGAVLVFIGAIYGLLGYLPTTTVNESASTTWAWLISSIVVMVVVGIAAIAVWIIAAAVASVVQDHDYTLVLDGTDLHMRRGLLQQREMTMALHRIQAVRITDNVLRRRFGVVAMQIQSGGGGTQANVAVSRLTIPIVAAADVDRILALVSPGATATPELLANPLAARIRWRFRAVAPILVVVAVTAALTTSVWSLAGLITVVPAWWWADRYYHSLGHAVGATHLVSRWGAVFRNTAVLPVAKVQGCRMAASPFQRRVGLATLRVAVAGDRIGVPVADAGAERLDTVRHDVLTSRASRVDEQATRRRVAAQRF